LTSMIERPPPHSTDAIRASRKGGKKVPKKYRKYHDSEKLKKQRDTSGMGEFTKVVHHVVKGLGRAFEALR
jgi:hypothetical protein